MDADALRVELIRALRDNPGLDWCPFCEADVPGDVDPDPLRERLARLLEDRVVELVVLVAVI